MTIIFLVAAIMIMLLAGRYINRQRDRMKFKESLDYLLGFIIKSIPSRQNYIYISGELTYLRTFNINPEQIDRMWSLFEVKYYDYFVIDMGNK